jgi:hypothetical protein
MYLLVSNLYRLGLCEKDGVEAEQLPLLANAIVAAMVLCAEGAHGSPGPNDSHVWLSQCEGLLSHSGAHFGWCAAPPVATTVQAVTVTSKHRGLTQSCAARLYRAVALRLLHRCSSDKTRWANCLYGS